MTTPSANSSIEPGDAGAAEVPPAPRSVIVVGLGNPGPRYQQTRHNVGFDLIDLLAARHRVLLDKRRCRAAVGTFTLDIHHVLLAKPLTFMNDSGVSVAALLRETGTAPSDLLVLVDDIHLPVGRLRLREKGSAGGQNGMKSIIAALGTDTFPRLRIGVGEPPPGLQVEWVLDRFPLAQRAVVDDALIGGVGAVETWIREGPVAAMNRVNAPGAN
ncbi:MAG: aminoacyl-tRNA hydrolase [Armatimonadota bacterium]